ncbi:MAG: DnaJ domain-containing protein [Bdellovibrionales bacterium]|nr:DnaJ domain-containing protein [Bdellovibrionales bacterium]
MPVEIHSKGSLKDQPVWALLSWILKESFSGVLMVSSSQKISVVFDQGQPIHLNFDQKISWFESYIQEHNITLPASLSDYIQTIPSEKHHQFEVELLQSSMIQYDDFQKVINELLGRAIKEMLSYVNGNYVFVQGKPKDVTPIKFKRKFRDMVFGLFLDTALTQKQWPDVPSTIVFTKLDKAVVKISDIQMNGKQQRIYRWIDGSHNADQLIVRTGFDEKYIKSFLQTLMRLEIIINQPPMLADAVKPIISDGITDNVTGKEVTTPEASSSDGAFYKRIQKFEDLESKNYFEILGVSLNANSAEIQQNYFALAKEYHPDRLKNLETKKKNEAEKIFSKITEAYNTLSNQALKSEYKASIENKNSRLPSGQGLGSVLESEQIFQNGLALLKKDNYKAAITEFKKAIEMYSEEPEYHVQLGWSCFRQGVKEKDEKLIRQGVELLQKYGKEGPVTKFSYYYIGMIEKYFGHIEKAKLWFTKATEADPNHARAFSELRVINMRKDKEQSHSIGIGKLFGKKK